MTRKLVSVRDMLDMFEEQIASVTDPEAKLHIQAFLQRCDFSKLPDWTPRPGTDLAPSITTIPEAKRRPQPQ